jgi:hypothetical protein
MLLAGPQLLTQSHLLKGALLAVTVKKLYFSESDKLVFPFGLL